MKILLPSIALLSLATVSSAQTVDAFSSFGPNESYDFGPAAFQNVGSPLPGGRGNTSVYVPFTATTTGDLVGFRVAMGTFLFTSDAQPFRLTLRSDSGGNVGVPLGFFSGTSSRVGYATPSDVVSVAAGGLTLTAGTTYWLQASNPSDAGDRGLAWNTAPVGTPPVRYATSVDGGGLSYRTGTPTAFSVQVAQVQATPEPVTMALGAGAFGLALRRRRKA